MSTSQVKKVNADVNDIDCIASKLRTGNFNSVLLEKYIDVNLTAMQSNQIAMKSNQLAMENLQTFNGIILKQLTQNKIKKDEAKSIVDSQSDSVAENKKTEASSPNSGIKIRSDELFINKNLTCVVRRLPEDFKSKLKINRRSDEYKADNKQDFQCEHCQLKFKLKILLKRHMESCHSNKEELENKSVIKPDSSDINLPTSSNDLPSTLNENDNNSVDEAENSFDSPVMQFDDECSGSESVLVLKQVKKPVPKKCSVVLSPLECAKHIEMIKQQKVATKARLLKRKIDQEMKSAGVNKNLRLITRDVTNEKLISKKKRLDNVLGYINTIYVNKPIRLS